MAIWLMKNRRTDSHTRTATWVMVLPLVMILLSITPGCRNDIHVVTINGERFTMEFAITEEEVTRGMGGREAFPDGGGMLFIFEQPRHRTFHMKDCLIDMDLIFLDGRGVVTAVHRMKKEPLQREDETEWEYESRLKQYHSHHPAQFAIEVEAGTIDRLDVRVDQRVEMDLDRLKKLAQDRLVLDR